MEQNSYIIYKDVEKLAELDGFHTVPSSIEQDLKIERFFRGRYRDVEFTIEINTIYKKLREVYFDGKPWSEINTLLYDLYKNHRIGAYVSKKLRQQWNMSILGNKIKSERLDYRNKEHCRILNMEVEKMMPEELNENSRNFLE